MSGTLVPMSTEVPAGTHQNLKIFLGTNGYLHFYDWPSLYTAINEFIIVNTYSETQTQVLLKIDIRVQRSKALEWQFSTQN